MPAGLAQLILRDQAGGDQQGITGDLEPVPGIGRRFSSTLRHHDRAHSAVALDLGHRAAVADGDVEILDTLGDIAGQAAE